MSLYFIVYLAFSPLGLVIFTVTLCTVYYRTTIQYPKFYIGGLQLDNGQCVCVCLGYNTDV